MNTKQIVMAAVAMLIAGGASAQAYPSKPIRIIPGQPGGGGYVQTQFIRDLLTSRLGQPVILDPRPASLMGGIIARAEPDGYTLMVAGNTVWYAPLLEKTEYDTLRDLVAIASIGSSPSILVVNPSVPVNSVKELIAYAKARPGALNYSSAASGSSYHLAAELFKTMTGTDIVRVSYKGAPPTILAVVSGEVQMAFGTSASVAPIIKSGKLKALAHTGLKPSALVPDLPSMAASGLPGFEITSTNVMFGPVKTPAAIIRRLNQDVTWAISQPGIKEKFLGNGAEPYPTTPEETAADVKSAYSVMGKLIKTAGITSD